MKELHTRSIMSIIICFCLFIPGSLLGQEKYEKWLQKQNEKLQEFKEERDKAFTEFLQQEWEKMQAMKGLVPDKKPKPIDTPVAEPVEKPEEEIKDSPEIEDIDVPEPIPEEKPTIIFEPEKPELKDKKKATTDFFGTTVPVFYDKNMLFNLNGTIDENLISQYWAALSKTDYEPLLTQFDDLKTQFRLNDWGYYVLIHEISNCIYSKNKNQSALLEWFVLLKSGYDVKVGYFENTIYLLVPFKQLLYENMYFTIDNVKYYAISFGEEPVRIKSLYTYDGKYPKADKTMNLNMSQSLNMEKSIVSKELRFEYDKQDYMVSTKYNENLIEFLKFYPHTDLDVYFNSLPSSDIHYSLLSDLKPVIQGKSEIEAVNTLLRFVQTAFQYKIDQEQFGKEKYLFPDETIFYPYSDCEDRSVLFAFLVERLTGLDVIGLDYPGHVATAVHFSNDIEGDSIIFKNKKYIICDPTYINAIVGLSMPKYRDMEPKIIVKGS